MRLKQTGALLLAGAMMVGTIGMMNPTQVQAADAAPTNQYTLTVPAETTLAYDGSAEALTNGLKVSGGDLEEGKKVTVTATSAGDWKLSASGATTKISYGLYATAEATETTTSWDFSKTEAAVTTGTTKTIYSKIVASEYQSAAAGDYSDTITFTAKVVDALTKAQVMSLVDASLTSLKNSDGQDVTNICGGGWNFTQSMEGFGYSYRVADNGNHVFSDDGDITIEVVVAGGKITKLIYIYDDGADHKETEYLPKAAAPTPAPVTVAGMTINAAEGQTWEEIAANNENVILTGDKWNRIKIDGNYLYSGAYVTANDTYSASKEYIIA